MTPRSALATRGAVLLRVPANGWGRSCAPCRGRPEAHDAKMMPTPAQALGVSCAPVSHGVLGAFCTGCPSGRPVMPRVFGRRGSRRTRRRPSRCAWGTISSIRRRQEPCAPRLRLTKRLRSRESLHGTLRLAKGVGCTWRRVPAPRWSSHVWTDGSGTWRREPTTRRAGPVRAIASSKPDDCNVPHPMPDDSWLATIPLCLINLTGHYALFP